MVLLSLRYFEQNRRWITVHRNMFWLNIYQFAHNVRFVEVNLRPIQNLTSFWNFYEPWLMDIEKQAWKNKHSSIYIYRIILYIGPCHLKAHMSIADNGACTYVARKIPYNSDCHEQVKNIGFMMIQPSISWELGSEKITNAFDYVSSFKYCRKRPVRCYMRGAFSKLIYFVC